MEETTIIVVVVVVVVVIIIFFFKLLSRERERVREWERERERERERASERERERDVEETLPNVLPRDSTILVFQSIVNNNPSSLFILLSHLAFFIHPRETFVLVSQRLECLVKMGPKNWSIGQWFHVFIGLRLRVRWWRNTRARLGIEKNEMKKRLINFHVEMRRDVFNYHSNNIVIIQVFVRTLVR